MTGWLLKNWLPLGAGSIVTALIAFVIHTLAATWMEASYELKLTEQKAALTKQCEDAKVITEEVSNEYQKQLAVRDASLADARRMLNKKCTATVVGIPTTGHNGSSGTGKSSGSYDLGVRVDAEELLDIATDGEKYRLQLLGCQDFIEKSRGNRLNQ